MWFTSKHFEQKSNRELVDFILCVGKELIAFQVKERNTDSEGNLDKWENEKVEKCKKWEYAESMEKLIKEPELQSLWNGGKKVINN